MLKVPLYFIFFICFIFIQHACAKSESPADTGEDEEVNLPPSQEDECGAIKVTSFPIINGSPNPDPAVVSLSTAQQNAIGALIINWGEAGCTGTLVSPNVVVTAAHCVENSPDFTIRSIVFYLGEDYTAPIATFSASEWHPHPSYSDWPPDYDIGVVILRGDPVSYGVVPIPVNCVTTSLRGRTIQAVGYGLTYPETGYNSRRWWTTLPVTSERTSYYVTYSNSTGTCQGDSGGPMLFTMADGVVRVMGVVSSGDSYNCLGNTYWPRTDAYCSFLSSYIPLDPCGGETFSGRCSGNTAIWCESNSIRTVNCSSMGYVCGLDSNGNYRCVVPPDPCGGETLQGRCEEGVAIYCDLGRIIRVDCAAEGYDCGLNSEGHYRCIERQNPCQGETYSGRCDGNVALWCEASTVMRDDCNIDGRICGQGVDGNFRCQVPDPCTGENYTGRCEGNIAIWCENNSVQRVACQEGTVCGDSGNGLIRCVGECLVTDMRGRCDEYGRAIWCEGGIRRIRDCAICGQMCGYIDDITGYYCY